jgi:hypothetical protein
MARLEVNFELVSPNAFSQGQEAGRKYADGFYEAFSSHPGVNPKTGKRGSGGSGVGGGFTEAASESVFMGMVVSSGLSVVGTQIQEASGALVKMGGAFDVVVESMPKAINEAGQKLIGMGEIIEAEIVGEVQKYRAPFDGGSGGGAPPYAFNPPGAEGGGEAEAAAGASLAASVVPVMIALAAFEVAMKALKAVVDGVVQSFQDAKRYYANATTSGFGLNMGIQRTSLAQIIGVGENEVWQYASAFNYLNDRLKWSSDILSQNSVDLTKTSYDFGVLQKDLQALYSTLAKQVNPTIDLFINALDELVRTIQKHAVDLVGTVIGALGGAVTAINPTLAVLIQQLGVQAELLDKAGNSARNKDLGEPSAFIKQFPASSWERMGLVIGGGAGTNYAQQTAQHTKRSADLNQKIYELLNKMNGHSQGMKVPQTYPARP